MKRPALIIAIAAIAIACEGRPKSTGDGEPVVNASQAHLAEFDLRRGTPERGSGTLFGSSNGSSFAHLVQQLETLGGDTEAKGVLVRLGTTNVAMAQADEIGRLLAKVREKKLPVVCHAHGYGNGTMLLAARGCDEIWLTPSGHVETIGLAAQLVFGRALLDRLDVHVDFVQVGKFKGAKEPFTRDSPSPEARQSLQTALEGIRSAWIEGIEKGRSNDAASLQIEDGPHTAAAAKQLGLIDELGFESQARERAHELATVAGKLVYFGGSRHTDDGLSELVRLLAGDDSMPLPHIALVRATGGISLEGSSGPLSSDGITHRALGRVLHKLKEDEATKAVVLRIDSPGGSALASDLLWKAMMDLRAKKPLIVTIGAMAASGGYYMACAGTKVVAERTTMIGSIGVVAGKLSFAASLEQVGIHVESIVANGQFGQRALYGSAMSRWDDATRHKVMLSIEDAYDTFIARIAEGRGMDPETIHPAAEGKLMSGDAAKAAGLVDEIGGIDRAIALAGELSGEKSLPIRILPSSSGLLSILGIEDAQARAAAAEQLERRAADRARRAVIAGLLPLQTELEVFAASVSPLLGGEHVLTALPFVVVLR